MNPIMLRMFVRAMQEEMIRNAERQRMMNGLQAPDGGGSMKKMALGLAILGVIVLLAVWASIALF